jgi:galactokinase
MKKHVNNLFFEKYNHYSNKTYFSPGRVNIIGEHTDYNGGLVMPFCIDKGLYAAVGRNDLKVIRIYSENFSILGIIEVDLSDIDYELKKNFGDYLLGVIKEIKSKGKDITNGLDIVLSSNLPVGGGLSSSAALTVLLLSIFNEEFSYGYGKIDIVKMAKSVENNFLGVKCGIMDQFVIAFGKENSAIMLDSKTLDFEYLPLDFEDFYFVLINSNTTRKLKDSKYNDRQAETEEVLRVINESFTYEYLVDISVDDLDEVQEVLKDEVLRKRLRHVVKENNRVKLAKEMILKKDFKGLGSLLTEAHYSLKNDYEVSTAVLDELVEMAVKSGALGSRMIGGGFGGSTLNLVLKKDFDGFIASFKKLYEAKYEISFIYSIVYAKDGFKRID